MSIKPHLILLILLCYGSLPTSAQQKQKDCPKLITQSKTLPGRARISNNEIIEIKGTAIYTVADYYTDDSLGGLLTYTITDADRQKIAQTLKKPLSDIPSVIEVPGVIANFVKLTDCPIVRLEILPMTLKIAEMSFRVNRFVLSFKYNGDDRLTALCVVARQVYYGLPVRRCFKCIRARILCQEKD